MSKWIAGLAAALWLAAGTAAATVTPPDETVKQTTEKLQTVIRQRHVEFQKNPDALYAAVEEIVVPHFDLKYIAQLILARHWRTATDEQRARFQVAFKSMLIRSYANALLEYYDSAKADWLPLRMPADASDVTVQSKLLRKNGPPLPIGFAMRLTDNEWKVYDITIESISLVTSFRSQVASEVKKNGLESLIQHLENGAALAKPAVKKNGSSAEASKGNTD